MSEFQRKTYIDLFAGIGGFHLALSQLGMQCVYASEIDPIARAVYEANFGQKDILHGDITLDENKRAVPKNADILTAGFPCQTFSLIGLRKGIDEARGTLFFDLADVISLSRPKALLLENVVGLLKHQHGKTLETMISILNEIGYTISFRIMFASDYGLPTFRPRLYIVGFRNDIKADPFTFPEPIPLAFTMSDVFDGECEKKIGYTIRCGGSRSGIDDRHNWDAYMVDGKRRHIGIYEAKCMMGYSREFQFTCTERQAMRLIGNSIAIYPVRMIAHNILKVLNG